MFCFLLLTSSVTRKALKIFCQSRFTLNIHKSISFYYHQIERWVILFCSCECGIIRGINDSPGAIGCDYFFSILASCNKSVVDYRELSGTTRKSELFLIRSRAYLTVLALAAFNALSDAFCCFKK